jgi:hypothetical protein
MLLSSAHRFYRGQWSAGRLVSHTSFHGEETTWVFDLVVDELGRLRAVTRTRAGRGAAPSLARVVDRAIIHPRMGRPHLPARLTVSSASLARELRDLSVELATTVAPTPELELLRPALEAMLIPQDGPWKWLDDECDRHSLDICCEQILDLGATFAWYTMSGQEAIRVESHEGREVLHIRLEAREGLDQRLRLALHVARDEATLEAWRKGRMGDNEIVIREILREELPREAFAERLEFERPESWVYPRVTVGVGGRSPTREEWQMAARALMSFNALHDPLEGDESGIQTRTLDNGDKVVIEVLDPEFDLFPENDGAIEGAFGSPEDREDTAFVEAYMDGAFDFKTVGRAELFA